MKIIDVINEFVSYSLNNGLIKDSDKIYLFNKIMGILKIDYRDNEIVLLKETRIIDDILSDLVDYAKDNKIIGDYLYERDLFDTLIMDAVTPLPSVVIDEFFKNFKESPKKATDYFFKLMNDVNYIRKNRIKKNISYTKESKYGKFLITINLSKPEKDPRVIASVKTRSDKIYPKCMLCLENVGFFGSSTLQARNNLRVIPLKLNNEDFYFQYSPYTYYNEHCIVFKKEHEDMKINYDTFRRLFDFCEMFPHYFLGSNADLGIVGGSILNHEHYQGGNFTFPLDDAGVRFSLNKGSVTINYLNWPLDVIQLVSRSRCDLLTLANRILDKWRVYTNKDINIIAYDTEPHNTITPIAKIKDGKYILNLVLRNNLVTKEHPYGLYHPFIKYHNIKKENIGLIEVMGLAILPPRLKGELALLQDILDKKVGEDRLKEIEIHRDWYNELKNKENVDVYQEAGEVFVKVLECCGVFRHGTEKDVKEFIDSI